MSAKKMPDLKETTNRLGEWAREHEGDDLGDTMRDAICLLKVQPELLKALEMVVAGAGFTFGYADPDVLRKNGNGLNVPIMYLQDARAAIAKAKGV